MNRSGNWGLRLKARQIAEGLWSEIKDLADRERKAGEQWCRDGIADRGLLVPGCRLSVDLHGLPVGVNDPILGDAQSVIELELYDFVILAIARGKNLNHEIRSALD